MELSRRRVYISKCGERQFSSVYSFAKHREMILQNVVRNCKTRNRGNGGSSHDRLLRAIEEPCQGRLNSLLMTIYNNRDESVPMILSRMQSRSVSFVIYLICGL